MHGGVIVYSINGKPITARSENQQKLVKGLSGNSDMIFAVGSCRFGKDIHQHRLGCTRAEE